MLNDFLDGHKYTHVQIIAYDLLPISISDRKENQIATIQIEPYLGCINLLVQTIEKEIEAPRKPLLIVVGSDNSDDYSAIDVGYGTRVTSQYLYSFFAEIGIIGKSPCGKPLKYIM